MRIVFLGSQELGARCLQVILNQGHDVVGVATFEPEAHENWTDEVARLADQHGVPRIRGRRFRTKKALDALRAAEPDYILAIGWRWILHDDVLAIPKHGCLGIHGSLLPRLRGFAPVNWALIRDAKKTGPSLFYFDSGIDTGDVVGQRPFPITDEDDAASVRIRLADASVELLEEYLPQLAAGTAPRNPQPKEGATYGPQRKPEHGVIDWDLNPRRLFNWVRGLTRPYPGAFTHLGGRRVDVWKVRVLEGGGPGPGVVVPHEDRLVVGTGAGRVEILDASFEGDAASDATRRVAVELRMRGSFDREVPARV